VIQLFAITHAVGGDLTRSIKADADAAKDCVDYQCAHKQNCDSKKLEVDVPAKHRYKNAIDIFLLSFGYCAIGTVP
jgi:hypothetical protein